MAVALNVTITTQVGGKHALLVTDLSKEQLLDIAAACVGDEDSNEVSEDLAGEISSLVDEI